MKNCIAVYKYLNPGDQCRIFDGIRIFLEEYDGAEAYSPTKSQAIDNARLAVYVEKIRDKHLPSTYKFTITDTSIIEIS